MTPLFPEFAQALSDYFAAIQQQQSPQPPPLRPLITQLDKLGHELLPVAPPVLRHYIERKSYEKALKFLHGETLEEKHHC